MKDVKRALRKAQEAMNAWLHQYAADHCNEGNVRKYADIVMSQGGTLAYIADVNVILRDALASIENQPAQEAGDE